MNSMLSPIVLFVYNRPLHTEQTIEALKKNELADKSDLFIYSDGPKVENDENVLKVREYIKTIDGFKSVTIIERDHNLGLAGSIISGVTEIVNKYGKVIVLEDDLVTSEFFLKFMNDALNHYENVEKVVCVSGFVPEIDMLPETFFLKGADCWGWGTWKRGWILFEKNGEVLLSGLKEKKMLREFDINGQSPRSAMLRDQISGKVDSWAIRWLASAYLNEKFCLYPGKTLINNIGLDGSGVNSRTVEECIPGVTGNPVKVEKIIVEECRYAKKKIEERSIEWNTHKNKGLLPYKIKIMIRKVFRVLQ